MHIEFCDICGESVPEGDLSIGEAKRFGERVVCKRCDEAMTRHVAPAAAALSASGDHGGRARVRSNFGGESSGALWLAGACVAVVALVGYLSVDRVQEAEQRVQSDVAGEMARLEDRIGDLEHLLRHSVAPALAEDPNASRFDAVDERLAAIESGLGSGAIDEDLLLAELERIAIDVQSLQRVVREEGSDDVLVERLAADVAALREDLSLLARSLLDVLEEGPVVAQVPADVKREAAEAQPDWLAFVGSLSSDEDGERWNAVEELGASGDPAAAEYVVPMLRDDELFVRMAAARVLGDLGNAAAISPLIDALDDQEPSVRESAVLSLRLLTERSFDFDPNGDVRDRTRAAKRWREWWASESGSGD